MSKASRPNIRDRIGLVQIIMFAMAILFHPVFASESMEVSQALAKIQNLGIHFELWNGLNLKNSRLYKRAKMIHVGQTQILNFEDSLLSNLLEIQENQGKVFLDSALFAQISAMILSDKINLDNQKLFDVDSLRADLTAELYGIDFAYVTVENLEACDFLQKAPLIFKGQWLVRVKNNLFLGLSQAGIQIMTAEKWVTQTRRNLNLEILEHAGFNECMLSLLERPSQKMRQTVREYIRFQRLEYFDNWNLVVYTNPN